MRVFRNGRWGILALSWHALILISATSYSAWRLDNLRQSHLPPTPSIEPRRVSPRNSRPELVDSERLHRVLARLTPDFGSHRPPINFVDHALRFWGVSATFDDDSALSGAELRELLLDHRAFAEAWGTETKPFLIPDTRGEGLRFRTRSGPATASHVDHTLAGLAEVGTPLDYPVLTPHGERLLIEAFHQSIREFSLNQEEYEWSTLVFLHYLSDIPQWYSSEGQLITWDRLAGRLMRQRLNQGVCYGQHRLYVLAALLQHDAQRPCLSEVIREAVRAHLADATARLVATQHAEGYWDGAWPGQEREGSAAQNPGPLGARADRLLATGHVLEWWAYAPPEALPADDVLQRTIDWLSSELEALSAAEIRRFYPFLTHGGRALALWSGQEPGADSQRQPR